MPDLEYLEHRAKWVRRQVLDMVVHAGKGHVGGALSCTDILVTLYYGEAMRFDPKNPDWEERDRFILSKGHACAALYAILSDLGYFAKSWIKDFNKEGATLEGHPHRGIPGIEADTGALGHGLSIGAGIALAAEIDGKTFRTIVLMGDGECMEGSVWEAAMFASYHKLKNLMAIVDRNKLCSTSIVADCSRVDLFIKQWRAFGWHVIELDGHEFGMLHQVLSFDTYPQPTVVIANTVKGKGVSFMENKVEWHHKVPDNTEIWHAREELRINE